MKLLTIRLGAGEPNVPSPEVRGGLREAAELRLADLAQLLDVDVSTVSRWERGLVEPRGAARLMYAALLATLSNEDTPPVGADGASNKTDKGGLDASGYRAR